MMLLRANAFASNYSGPRVELVERLHRLPQCGPASGDPAKGLGRRLGRPRAARPYGGRGLRLRGGRDDLSRPAACRRARPSPKAGFDARFRPRRQGCLGAHQRLDRVARARRAGDERCPPPPQACRHRHVPVARGHARRARGLRSARARGAPASGPGRGSRAISCASSRASKRCSQAARDVVFPDEAAPTRRRRRRPRVQDVYSLRCTPQVHGPAVEAVEYVERIIGTEINSATDNPLIFDDGKGGYVSISGGHFHGQYVAQAMDLLAIAMADLGVDLRAPPRAPDRSDDVLWIAAQPARRQARPQYGLCHRAMLHVGAGDGEPRPRDAGLGRFHSGQVAMPRTTSRTPPGADARRAPSWRTSEQIVAGELLMAAQALTLVEPIAKDYPLGKGSRAAIEAIRGRHPACARRRPLVRDRDARRRSTSCAPAPWSRRSRAPSGRSNRQADSENWAACFSFVGSPAAYAPIHEPSGSAGTDRHVDANHD